MEFVDRLSAYERIRKDLHQESQELENQAMHILQTVVEDFNSDIKNSIKILCRPGQQPHIDISSPGLFVTIYDHLLVSKNCVISKEKVESHGSDIKEKIRKSFAFRLGINSQRIGISINPLWP